MLDGEITVTAELASNPESETSEFACLRDGEVTLGELMPSTLYAVNAIAVHNSTPLLEFTENIQTLGIDKMVQVIVL